MNQNITKMNGTWGYTVKVVYPDYTIGTERKSGFLTEEEAYDAQQKDQKEYETALNNVKKKTNMKFTFCEYMEHWFSNIYYAKAGSTISVADYAVHTLIIENCNKDTILSYVNPDYLNAIIERCLKISHSAGFTAKKILRIALESAYLYGFVKKDFRSNLISVAENTKTMELPTKEELKRFLAAAKNHEEYYFEILCALLMGLRKGEILGFSGLMGAGRTETARALFGADPKQSGKISIRGKDGQLREVTINSPQDAVKYGIGYLSEDRRRYGCVVQKSVTENTTLATMEEFTSGIFINKSKEKEVSEKYVKELATKTPNCEQLVVNLSGGNQQKVVIAKWLTRDSEILIFDEPTRGIDVGAKNEIYKLMNRLAAEGKSIIMISSEMTEVLRMSDRIIVMCEGKITGNIDISEATQEHIMNHATRNIN